MIPHSVGKCRGATKGTLSRQEPAVSNANRLMDCSGSLEKGGGPLRQAGGISWEFTEFKKNVRDL